MKRIMPPLPPLLLVALPTLLMSPACGNNVSDVVFGSYRHFLPTAFGDYNGDKQTLTGRSWRSSSLNGLRHP